MEDGLVVPRAEGAVKHEGCLIAGRAVSSKGKEENGCRAPKKKPSLLYGPRNRNTGQG